MLARLTWADRALLGLFLPVYVAVLALHVQAVREHGLAQLPVYVSPDPAGGAPRVAGYRLETPSEGSGLEIGDRLLRIGTHDLRGVGYLGFDVLGLDAVRRGDGSAPLLVEREGRRFTLPLDRRSYPHPWYRLPLLLIFPLVSTLLVLRAPGSPDAQRFFLAFMTYALIQAQFYGGAPWTSWLSFGLWNLLTPVVVFLVLRYALRFPAELPEAERAWAGWPWLGAAAFVLVRLSYLTGGPIPGLLVGRVSHGLHAAAMLAAVVLLARNYLHVEPVGRRRIKWVLYGAMLGSLPLVLALLIPLVDPAWGAFRESFALGTVVTVAWMVCTVFAIVRHNAFDIDRLIGATTAWSAVAVCFLVALLAGVPAVATHVAPTLRLGETQTQLLLAMCLAVLVVPVGRRLRPQVDRLFFPERLALERGVQGLLEDLSRCTDPQAVTQTVASRCVALLRPAGHALYQQRGELLEAVEGEGLATPAQLAPAVFAVGAQERRSGVLQLVEWRERRRAGPHSDALAALAAAGAAVALPLRLGDRTEAVLLLGPKRSGDVYTGTDLACLAAVAERANAELLRFRFARSLRAHQAREGALRSEKERAAQDSLAKTRVIAAASHDIRQPLHALGLLVEALQGRALDDESRALLDRIRRSTGDLDELITSLLDLSRLESGGVEPKPGRFPLGELLERLADEFGETAREHGLTLRVRSTDAWVHSDRLLLLRILRNLVANAVRYTRSGGVLVGVRRDGPDGLRIEVVDTGPGIPEETRTAIFREFRQGPAAEGRGDPGLGLGLAIVERLAGLLGHAIGLRSEPGRGSAFSVTVPRVPTPGRAKAPAAPDAEAARPSAAGRPRTAFAPAASGPAAAPPGVAALAVRVLVIEDDRAAREALEILLRSFGCEVRAADGLEQALRCGPRAGWQPELVLSDLHLGEGPDGAAVVEALRREADAPIPAAILTADRAPARMAALREAGLRVLPKPVPPARLRALVSGLVARPAS